jgi:hypothetical protein
VDPQAEALRLRVCDSRPDQPAQLLADVEIESDGTLLVATTVNGANVILSFDEMRLEFNTLQSAHSSIRTEFWNAFEAHAEPDRFLLGTGQASSECF